jgi:hypothetical protein
MDALCSTRSKRSWWWWWWWWWCNTTLTNEQNVFWVREEGRTVTMCSLRRSVR